MAYEYEAIPNDAGDYRRRRDALARQIEDLPKFVRRYGPYEAGLDESPQRDPRWGDRVRLQFGETKVWITCIKPLSEAVLADLRESLRMIGGAAGLRLIDECGDLVEL